MVCRQMSHGPGGMDGVGGLQRRKIQGMAFVKIISLFPSVFSHFIIKLSLKSKTQSYPFSTVETIQD